MTISISSKGSNSLPSSTCSIGDASISSPVYYAQPGHDRGRLRYDRHDFESSQHRDVVYLQYVGRIGHCNCKLFAVEPQRHQAIQFAEFAWKEFHDGRVDRDFVQVCVGEVLMLLQGLDDV